MAGLTMPEIMKVVNDYIGTQGGYLGDFSYTSHAEFYHYYCDLDINPNSDAYRGTTRTRFMSILRRAVPRDAAKILRGVIAKYPLNDDADPKRKKTHADILAMVARLDGATPVEPPNLRITSDVVQRAIGDAETLIKTRGATSGVDRIHTAVHGYLIAACDSHGITHAKDATLVQLLKHLQQKGAALEDRGARAADIAQILRSFTAVLDVLNPVRNQASVAHPNPTLLEKDEAMLVINAVRTILHYLDAKLNRAEPHV